MTKANRRPNVTCDLCLTPMYRRPSTLTINAGKFCSRACRNKVHREQCPRPCPTKRVTGARNGSWKGGVMTRRPKGNYKAVRYVRCPPDLLPMARTDGYVMEHRLVMARWVGRCLTRTETVHHLDHDPTNNPRSNLELWPDNGSHKRAEHGQFVEGAVNAWSPRA